MYEAALDSAFWLHVEKTPGYGVGMRRVRLALLSLALLVVVSALVVGQCGS